MAGSAVQCSCSGVSEREDEAEQAFSLCFFLCVFFFLFLFLFRMASASTQPVCTHNHTAVRERREGTGGERGQTTLLQRSPPLRTNVTHTSRRTARRLTDRSVEPHRPLLLLLLLLAALSLTATHDNHCTHRPHSTVAPLRLVAAFTRTHSSAQPARQRSGSGPQPQPSRLICSDAPQRSERQCRRWSMVAIIPAVNTATADIALFPSVLLVPLLHHRGESTRRCGRLLRACAGYLCELLLCSSRQTWCAGSLRRRPRCALRHRSSSRVLHRAQRNSAALPILGCSTHGEIRIASCSLELLLLLLLLLLL